MSPSDGPHSDVSTGTPLVVEVIDATGRFDGAARSWLEGMARRAGGELAAAGDVRVRIVDDAEMAAAHQRYSGIAGTTDVLTFDLTDEPGVLDLDILVCLDEAERQAERRAHPARHEVLLYTVHGMLHGLGYDDHEEGDYAEMHAAEDRVLGAIGVGVTFAREGEGGAA